MPRWRVVQSVAHGPLEPRILVRVQARQPCGEVSERFKEHAWKACVGETQPWVRIPPSPPSNPANCPLRCLSIEEMRRQVMLRIAKSPPNRENTPGLSPDTDRGRPEVASSPT